jgi:phage-related protein
MTGSPCRQTELAHRIIYVVAFEEWVYVLHAFAKKTRKTPPHEVTLARDRYRALLKKRANDGKKR